MKILNKNLYALIATAGLLLVSATTQADNSWPPTGNASAGAKAWSDNCGRCHNIRDGKELRDDQWISTMYHMRIRAGLTGQTARDITSFLQASNNAARKPSTRKSSSANTAATEGLTGADIYAQTCIACHGADGKGVVPGTPNFTDKTGRLAKTDEQLLNSILNGFQSPGSPMAMPAKGGNSALAVGDLKNVLKYLRKTF